MVVRKRKKYAKYVGKRYARRGYNDRNRGAGSRGGRGKSGWRFAKHKLHKILKEYPELFKDKKGFSPVKPKEINVINVGDIESNLKQWLELGLAHEENGLYVVDVKNLGYDKVLGRGSISIPIKLITPAISESAKEKIESAGGSIVLENN